MKKEKKGDSFIKQPYYEGGDNALKEFVVQHLTYPPQALENEIEGSIPITYDINYKGIVTDVKLLHQLGYGCDEEAIRLVKMLKFTVPKIPRHLRVIFHKRITIHFRLPVNQGMTSTPTSQHLQYTITKENPKESIPQTATYHYTINIERG